MAYFDHNATAPLAAAARQAWIAAQDDAWQNPAGAYRSAARVRALVDRERARLAAMLGAAPEQVVATSGATEAANTVMAHLAGNSERRWRILINPTEHSCVRLSAERHFAGRIEWLPLSAEGRVDPATVRERLSAGDVAAVVVMAANNETGVLQPWRELAVECHSAGVPYVCDAVQWLGRLPAAGLGTAGFVFGSAHKFGGPKGTGLLVLPSGGAGADFRFLVGGGQQGGRRAGTEDWPALAAMVAALAEAEGLCATEIAVRTGWRARFEAGLCASVAGGRIVGAGTERLWNTSMAVLPAGESQRWLTKLDKRGFEVSTTAACASAQGRSSAVLAALGVPETDARRALRFSAGWETTEADWLGLLEALGEVWREIGAGGGVL